MSSVLSLFHPPLPPPPSHHHHHHHHHSHQGKWGSWARPVERGRLWSQADCVRKIPGRKTDVTLKWGDLEENLIRKLLYWQHHGQTVQKEKCSHTTSFS